MLIANHNFCENRDLTNYIRKTSEFFIKNDFICNFISNLVNFEIGSDVDVLISFTEQYDVTKIYARNNIIKILVVMDFNPYNYENWDIIIVNDLKLKDKLKTETNNVFVHYVKDLSELGGKIISFLYMDFIEDKGD